MDQTENQKKQSLSQIIKSQFHKKLTKLLLSVSVFSLFCSHSYWISLFRSLNFHNTLPFQLFSHTIDKNCIFLLCNGLLVFVAKYSGLISSSSKYEDQSNFKSYEDVPQSEPVNLEEKAPLLEKEIALESADQALENSIMVEGRHEEEKEEAEAETEIGNFTVQEEEEEEEEKWGLMTLEEEENGGFVEEDEGEVKGSENDLFVQEFEESENYGRDYEEEEVVEGNRVLSTEELNKRFDEFIRKMKEELRIEARQQLVMV
ncbi:hypothetical protein CCACVL1_11248 [Corchorus capsularis]|uniref:DUF4408 domain-containing protein n=1 Tax=Corchorus capsularis TaxID=210143 RepID=A0A1R3IME0_COCAP|nr:hypothetical protein CCACVL1_11248 [Corchorus capsularis]